MATALGMMRGGLSSGTAKAINGEVNGSVTAGTTQTQAGATALVSSISIVATVATAGDGVRLPNTEIGDSYEILNIGANYCTVYPPTSGRINALATNGGFVLATNTAVRVKKFTSTRWVAFLSA